MATASHVSGLIQHCTVSHRRENAKISSSLRTWENSNVEQETQICGLTPVGVGCTAWSLGRKGDSRGVENSLYSVPVNCSYFMQYVQPQPNTQPPVSSRSVQHATMRAAMSVHTLLQQHGTRQDGIPRKRDSSHYRSYRKYPMKELVFYRIQFLLLENEGGSSVWLYVVEHVEISLHIRSHNFSTLRN